MKEDIQKLVGICGLYCGTCAVYLAYRENDVEQLERISREYGIPIEEVRCDDCLSDGVDSFCKECPNGFRQCANQHEVTWCFECADFPCQRLRDFTGIYIVNGISVSARVIDDIQYMKEHELQRWVEEQRKASCCPQCGKRLYWFTRVCPDCDTKIR